MELEITSALTSYGDEYDESVYGKDAEISLKGRNMGNLETGGDSEILYYFFRHDGSEPIYDVGLYLKAVGTEWGGYCKDYPDSDLPYNPNVFRSGGVDDNNHALTSTEDYEFLRKCAKDNPEMGVRLHQDRTDETVKTKGLGSNNQGLSFSVIPLSTTSLDYSKTSNDQTEGLIYPEPVDSSKKALAGDEAKIGVSVKLPEETEGAGHIQFAVAFKYRYTQ